MSKFMNLVEANRQRAHEKKMAELKEDRNRGVKQLFTGLALMALASIGFRKGKNMLK